MSYDEKKYRPGLGRDVPAPRIAHLYEIGDGPMDFLNPMCIYGWNRDNHAAYSIWRGNVGRKGICKICIRRAEKGLPGVDSPVPYEDDDFSTLLTPEEQAEVDKLLKSV